MKPKILIFLTTILLVSPAFIYSQSDNSNVTKSVNIEKFDPNRDAALDINNAIHEAGKTHKRIILDIGGEWCIWCHRLDSLFIKHQDLAKYREQNYIYVKINYSKENKNEKVLAHYPKIPGFPHWFVLDTDGKLLKSESSGEFEEGKGHSPEKIMAFLKEWALKKTI